MRWVGILGWIPPLRVHFKPPANSRLTSSWSETKTRYGIVWINSHSAVFLIGAAFALCSLVLSQNVPQSPEQGNEVVFPRAA